jgi:hypothetical protein
VAFHEFIRAADSIFLLWALLFGICITPRSGFHLFALGFALWYLRKI